MIGRNTVVKVTVVAALGVASYMVAQQPGTDMQKPSKQQAGNTALGRPVTPVNRKSANRGSEQDPNFPMLGHDLPGAPITWSANGRTVTFNTPRANGGYLGFLVKGSKTISLLVNGNDKKVYGWSLPEGAAQGTLAVFAESVEALPTDDILALRNSQYSEGMLEDRGIRVVSDEPGNDTTPDNQQSVPSTPSVPVGALRQMHGSSARIAGGVLTFTVNDADSPDNGKQVKYKVARGAMMMNPNAPADASSIAGQWMADDPNDKDSLLLFFVQANGTVAMQVFSGPAAVAMKRMAAMAPSN